MNRDKYYIHEEEAWELAREEHVDSGLRQVNEFFDSYFSNLLQLLVEFENNGNSEDFEFISFVFSSYKEYADKKIIEYNSILNTYNLMGFEIEEIGFQEECDKVYTETYFEMLKTVFLKKILQEEILFESL